MEKRASFPGEKQDLELLFSVPKKMYRCSGTFMAKVMLLCISINQTDLISSGEGTERPSSARGTMVATSSLVLNLFFHLKSPL